MKIDPVIKKEMLSIFRTEYSSKIKQFFSMLLTILINAVIIAFIVYLFYLVDSNIRSFKTSSVPSLSASTLVFIFLITIIIIVYTVIYANQVAKTLYSEDDKYNIRVMPISKYKIILPKLFAVFLKILLTFSILFLTLLITYGVLHPEQISWWYYPLSIAFTFTTSFIILFFATLTSYPLYLLKSLINRHSALQIVSSLVIVAVLTFIYFEVLLLFINVSTGTIAWHEVFNEANMDSLAFATEFLVPTNYMVLVLVNHNKWIHFIVYVILFLISIVAVYYIAKFYYGTYCRRDDKFQVVLRSKNHISRFPVFKKDIKLMFRNTSGAVSFFVIAIVSAIFSSLIGYLLKELISQFAGIKIINYLYFPLLVLFITLFISLVFSSETKLFHNEKKTSSLILTIPYKFKTQLLSKMLINLALLFAVNFIVFILVTALGVLPVLNALALFAISLLITGSCFLLSVSSSLSSDKSLIESHSSGNKGFLYSLFIPLFIFVIAVGMIVGCYFMNILNGINDTILILVILGFTVVVFILSSLKFYSKIKGFSKRLATGGGL